MKPAKDARAEKNLRRRLSTSKRAFVWQDLEISGQIVPKLKIYGEIKRAATPERLASLEEENKKLGTAVQSWIDFIFHISV